MSDLLVRAELVKLSRALGASVDAVTFLAPLGHLRLRQLEDRVSDALFNEHRAAFQRLVDASRVLPASLIAKMSELVFGPMLSARIAGLMPPERAVEVSLKLRTKFLADVCMELDPRSASELLAITPTRTVVDVARVLLQRGEHVTMGRFVDDLTDEAIRAVAADITDDEALLRIGCYVERRARLIELIDLLPPERLGRLVAAVARGSPEVQASGLTVMSQLSERQQARFGEFAIGLGAPTLGALVAAALREDALEVIETVLAHIGVPARQALAQMLAGSDPALTRGLPAGDRARLERLARTGKG